MKPLHGLAALSAASLLLHVTSARGAEPTDATRRPDAGSSNGTALASWAQVGDEPPTQTGTPTIPHERVVWHIPDPELSRQDTLEKLEQARKAGDNSTVTYITRVLDRTDAIRRTDQFPLTLEDVIRRTLLSNYTIQTVSYNPAIEATRVVEAQSAFDTIFNTTINKEHIDQPTGTELAATSRDFFLLNSSLSKLLPTGAQASAAYQLTRTKQDFAFQIINPEYFSKFILEARQPLLRGFGLDFNRSLILIAQTDRRISQLAFRRQVRDTLREIEELYWRLFQARRDIVVTARLLAEFEAIYDYLVARQDFDVTKVQIDATKADLELAQADFVLRRAGVFDAEDRLIAAINDPELNLAENVELIPMDFPALEHVIVDPVAEAQAALDHRTEIKEQELRVANAKVAVGRAINAELPRFDVTFRTTYDGLGQTADTSFDEVTGGNFIEYFVGVEFEVPVGNRGPRAARRRARLQHDQAVAQLRATMEDIILDVHLAVRQLTTSFDQISPNFESAEARVREVESIVARAERKDYNTLINELGARRTLAQTRRALLGAMVDYNIAIIDLERAKGTLLPYNSVVIPNQDD